ncbi:ribonuclease VapC [Bacteroidia bacterium]|nr:ribonuclease VapC [Bacteroidia bacterium]
MDKIYIDSSAFLKLIFSEEYSSDIRLYLVEHESRITVVSSKLLETEVIRTAVRESHDMELVQRALGLVQIYSVDDSDFTRAAKMAQNEDGRYLRALDAIHLACAEKLAVTKILTYDKVQSNVATLPDLRLFRPERE